MNGIFALPTPPKLFGTLMKRVFKEGQGAKGIRIFIKMHE